MTVDILEALADRRLLGSVLRQPDTWAPWLVFLTALFGLPMTAEQIDIYRACTRRMNAPAAPFNEAHLIVGRRGRKSFTLALIAVFLAAFRDWRPFLGPGERGTIMVIATDRKQARVIFRYIRGILNSSPMLAEMVERELGETIDLNRSVSIEVGTASHRTTRGYSIIAALCDELAYWPSDESADPDYAVLDAIRPGMATIPGAMLLCASSPHAKRGALYDAFKRYYGNDDAPVPVWKAPTRLMNPTVPQSVIDAAMARDPASASAEYLAEFRQDIEQFVLREVVEAAIDSGVTERAPIDGILYVGFVDPSGGAQDAMTLAIAHNEKRILTLDATRERKPPFSPEAVVAEFADTLKRYHISTIEGDRYAGEWPREAFARHGITYRVAGRTRSELYLHTLPELNSKSVALLDNPKIVTQFSALERRTSRGGRDVIDHSPGAHDDLCNAIAGALLMAKPAAVQQLDVMSLMPFTISCPDAVSAPHLSTGYYDQQSGSNFNFPW
jgi:Phage Terminase